MAPGLRRSLISAATATLVVGSLVLGEGAGPSASARLGGGSGADGVAVNGSATAGDVYQQLVPPGVDVPGVTNVTH